MGRPTTTDDDKSASERRTMLALALFVLSIYMGTVALRIQSIDEIAVYSVTRSLVGRGTFDADVMAWVQPLMGPNAVVAPGADGHTYSIKDLGPSILAIPLYVAGRLTGDSPVRAMFFLMPLVAAATVALFYNLVRSWGYSRATGVIGALAYGLGTMAWPYTRTLFTQPLAGLGLMMATWGACRATAEGRKRMAVLGGIGLGLAGMSAVPTWITVPVYGLYFIPWGSLRGADRRPAITAAAKLAGLFLAGAGLFLALQMGYNLGRFGSPFQTGYQLLGNLNFSLTYFGMGGFGQLISTPRGIVWYAPVVVLAVPGIALAVRGGRSRPLLLALGQISLVFCLYSLNYFWWGGGSYGPRYLMTVMPLLTLLAVPALDLLARPARVWVRLAVGGVVALSIATEAMGSVVDIYQSYNRMYDALLAVTPPPSFFVNAPVMTDPTWLPQVHFPLLIGKGQFDLLVLANGGLDWPLLACQIGLGVLAALVLIAALRLPGKIGIRWALAGQAGLIAGLMLVMLARYPRVYGFSKTVLPTPSGLVETLTALAAEARPGDGIIEMLYHPASDAWFDRYDGRIHDIGLTIEAPLRAETLDKLAHVQDWHSRVWLVSNRVGAGDPANGIEAWFAQRAYCGGDAQAGEFRWVGCAFPSHIGPLQPASQEFGEHEIGLTGYAFEVIQHPGWRWLNVWLRWQGLRSLTQDYTVFVHLTDASGAVVAQHDGWPVAAYAPTTSWPPGTPVDDRHGLDISPALPPGDYRLSVGLYDGATGRRLAVAGSDDGSLDLGVVRISPN